MCERYICGMGFTSEEKPIRIIHDKVEDKDYYLFADLCKIMNEQQTEIDNLKEENGQLRQFINKGRRLSVKEIMDNANENELLKKKIRGFEKENEQLREELNDCEKFRYSVFKRIEKTIEDKDNCAINKDAKYPCKAYDECLKRKGTNKPLPCMVNWVMGRPFENMIRKEGDDE